MNIRLVSATLFVVGCLLVASAHGQVQRAAEVQPHSGIQAQPAPELKSPTRVPAVRTPELQLRIGAMSDEVVREKFRSYGIDVAKLERHPNMWVVHTQIEGKPALLEMDPLNGAIKHEGQALRIKPLANAAPLVIKPDPQRIPWNQRAIRFEKLGVEGIRVPALPSK